MILLTADRLDMSGKCRFKITAAGLDPVVTCNIVKAARALFRLGVNDPLGLVEHARDWGSVEIFEPDTGRRTPPEHLTGR